MTGDLEALGLARAVDGVTVLSECGLFLDVPLGEAVAPGDWIATAAGARYLVLTARRVVTRRHAQCERYTLRVGRLQRGRPVPDDVVCWQLRWYPRRRRPS